MSDRSLALLVVVGIPAVFLFFGASLPISLNKARMYAQETGAIKALRTLQFAESQYCSRYGRFAGSLSELGPPATGERHGYKFTLS